MFTYYVVLTLAFVLLVFKFLSLIHVQCKSNVCLVGKTALVTGGNSGIGYQIVLGLLQRGCKVIIADKIKDPNLLEDIFKETKSRNVVFEYVDLSSLQSTRDLANNVRKNEEKLDILIHNAGIGGIGTGKTEDGLGIIMQINFFSAFLLTHLLVDLLKKAKGRIIFTSSILSYFHSFSIENLKPSAKNYIYQYSNSKLCLIIVSDIFAEKLKRHGVTSNTYHPGLVRTNIFQRSIENNIMTNSHLQWFLAKLGLYWSHFGGINAQQGAQTALHLACATEVENITGEFFFETKPRFKPQFVHNKNIVQAVWKLSEELVKLTPEERL